MKSIVIHGPKDLRIENSTVAAPGPGQVQIAMAVGGICGSDLHYYSHGGFGAIRLREPMVLGHEVAGYIAALGEGVTVLSIGKLVSVSPSRPCNSCKYCLIGQQNHCLNMRFYGSAMPFPHIQGAFRQTLNVDASQCTVADGLTPAEAAMAEPLAVVLHAARKTGSLIGKSVLVTGCGPIGALAVLVARRAGAELVVATDLSDFTLNLANQIGADQIINMASNPNGLGRFAAEKGIFDVLFECSGAAAALSAAVPAMRPGGTIMQLGLGGDMLLPMQVMTAKELTIKGSFRFHEEFATGVGLMQKRLIDVKPLITHTFGIDDAISGFELASDRKQSMKAQISFA